MFRDLLSQMKIGLSLLLLLMLLTGVIYPLVITAAAEWLFPIAANGSLIEKKGQWIGSRFIGQSFSGPDYFWGRPSATMPYPYNAAASSGSNAGPSNVNFLTLVASRIKTLRSFDVNTDPLIPVDLVTASASGLDPEISPLAAFYQVSRIAKARHISEVDLHALVQGHIKGRSWGFLGEPRVNVLELNLALDAL